MFKSVSFWAFAALGRHRALAASADPRRHPHDVRRTASRWTACARLPGNAVRRSTGRTCSAIICRHTDSGLRRLLRHVRLKTQQIAAESAKLESENRGLALKFDPAVQALIIKDAWEFTANHKIPVAYELNERYYIKAEYYSYRRLPGDQCKEASSTWSHLPTALDRADINIHYRSLGLSPYDSTWNPSYGDIDMNICLLVMPEKPHQDTVSVVENSITTTIIHN